VSPWRGVWEVAGPTLSRPGQATMRREKHLARQFLQLQSRGWNRVSQVCAGGCVVRAECSGRDRRRTASIPATHPHRRSQPSPSVETTVTTGTEAARETSRSRPSWLVPFGRARRKSGVRPPAGGEAGREHEPAPLVGCAVGRHIPAARPGDDQQPELGKPGSAAGGGRRVGGRVRPVRCRRHVRECSALLQPARVASRVRGCHPRVVPGSHQGLVLLPADARRVWRRAGAVSSSAADVLPVSADGWV
jgi:hypothetical protein